MPQDELTALLRLNRIEGIGCTTAKVLYNRFGSAREIFLQRSQINEIIPGASQRLIQALEDSGYDSFIDNELEFIERHGIRCISPADAEYPDRLRDCNDAPLLLFTLGNVTMNAKRTVAIVGTRKATDYGRRMCRGFVRELKSLCPDCTVISGLALGIDVEAHKAAIENNTPTIAVLAHGLDMIYPSSNRDTAAKMLAEGGLVTEFPTHTQPLKGNFIQRNRIIAGLADAVIVVESAGKSGSLVTAELAASYNRECFAFPGSVGDPYSVGCNELIRDNRAGLITSALDFVNAMGWNERYGKPENIQKELFPKLTHEEQAVYDKIARKAQGVQVNTLIVELNIPFSKLCTIMFSLEMKGLARMMGSTCRLI